MDLKGKKVGFLGDSITEGAGASSSETCYVSLFAKAHPECRVYNYGIGGTRIAFVQHNPVNEIYERNPVESRLKMMEDDLDIVFVFGGTNDYGHGDAPFGNPQDNTRETFCGSLNSLCCALIEKYPFAKIIFMTPMHRWNEGEAHKKSDGDYCLNDYVRVIRERAEYFSFPVLDLWATLGIQPAIAVMRTNFTTDGLHPNDAGHRRVFEAVEQFLR